MKMLKTVLLCFVALHAVIGQDRKPHPKIAKVTCRDLRPQGDTHNRGVEDPGDIHQQYDIKLSKSQMNAKDTVQFTISGKDGNTMKGFIIQLRSEGSTTPVGKFISHPLDPIVNTMKCGNEEKDTALIRFPVPPKMYLDFQSVSLAWTPNGYEGKVDIVATIVKTGNVFWVSRKLAVLKIHK